MYVASSSHKRRRPSARADAARRHLPGRIILNIAGFRFEGKEHQQRQGQGDQGSSIGKGKGKAKADTDTDAERRSQEMITSHCFNHRLTLLLPEAPEAHDQHRTSSSSSSLATSNLQGHLLTLFSHCKTYYVCVSLSIFLHQTFLNSYVRSPANLIALSKGGLDVDDIVCLTGDGQLLLQLTRETYQTLGLQGRPTQFNRGSSGRMGERTSGGPTRYTVSIPLVDPTFVPGKPGYQRVVDAFERWEKQRGGGDRREGKFTLFMATSSMSQIRFPTEMVKQGDVDCLRPAIATGQREDVWVPDIAAVSAGPGRLDRGWSEDNTGSTAATDDSNWIQWAQTCEDFAGWTKLLSRDAEGIKTYYRHSELPISSYEMLEPRHAGKISTFSIRGFLHSEVILKALSLAKKWTDDASLQTSAVESGDLSWRRQGRRWFYISSSGFASSPVRWRSHDPGWGLGLGQGRSHEDGRMASRSRGAGKGGKGIFEVYEKVGQGKMNRFKRLAGKGGGESTAPTEDEEEMSTGHDDDCDTNLPDASSGSDDEDDDEDYENFEPWRGPSTSVGPGPRTGKKARRKRAKLVKRRGHLRKGYAERAGAVGGTVGEEGWGVVLFGRGGKEQSEERPRGDAAGARGVGEATARLLWWENVEGDTRS